jgi:hypothetical protein
MAVKSNTKKAVVKKKPAAKPKVAVKKKTAMKKKVAVKKKVPAKKKVAVKKKLSPKKKVAKRKSPSVASLVAKLETRVSVSKLNKQISSVYAKAQRAAASAEKKVETTAASIFGIQQKIKDAKTANAKSAGRARLAAARLKLSEAKTSLTSAAKSLKNEEKLVVAMDRFHTKFLTAYDREANKVISNVKKAVAKPRRKPRKKSVPKK